MGKNFSSFWKKKLLLCCLCTLFVSTFGRPCLCENAPRRTFFSIHTWWGPTHPQRERERQPGSLSRCLSMQLTTRLTGRPYATNCCSRSLSRKYKQTKENNFSVCLSECVCVDYKNIRWWIILDSFLCVCVFVTSPWHHSTTTLRWGFK